MKRFLALTLFMVAVSPAQAQKPKPRPAPVAAALLNGLYEGDLLVPGGTRLRLVLHFDSKGGGTWDSPQQGANGLKLSRAQRVKDTVTFAAETPPFQFTGKRSADGKTITGTFTQNGLGMPLSLKKVAQVTQVRRPQTPRPPYPYTSVEVGFTNPAEAGVTLAGTLTLPAGSGPFPCAVFITGSGQQDRDETLFQHKPFAVIADDLARRGIASLRCDDRGVGKSAGDLGNATSASFATDIEAAVGYLKTRPEINKTKIGLIGHSEGGLIAPLVAARRENGIAFVVLLAGPGVSGDQILLEQGALIARAQGAPEAVIALTQQNQKKLFPIIVAEADAQKALEKMATALGVPDIQRLPPDAVAQLRVLTSPWMRYFLSHDPASALATLRCPVLALNGGKDLQVSPTQNLPAIEKALKAGGNRDRTLVELPGLNHLFQHAKTGSPTEYGEIEETFAPEALQRIGEWIVARTKKD